MARSVPKSTADSGEETLTWFDAETETTQQLFSSRSVIDHFGTVLVPHTEPSIGLLGRVSWPFSRVGA